LRAVRWGLETGEKGHGQWILLGIGDGGREGGREEGRRVKKRSRRRRSGRTPG